MTRRKDKQWSPDEWAAQWMPFNEAFARIAAKVGSKRVAADDLYRLIMCGQLETAARHATRDGRGVGHAFPSRAFWKDECRIADSAFGGVHVYPVRGKVFPPGDWIFYVRRDRFDRKYPEADAAAGQPVEGGRQPMESARRKPGPRRKWDWDRLIAREVIRYVRAGKKIPAAAKFAQLCEDEFGYQPDIREVQKLLRKLFP
jgi:hypothetical protein